MTATREIQKRRHLLANFLLARHREESSSGSRHIVDEVDSMLPDKGEKILIPVAQDS